MKNNLLKKAAALLAVASLSLTGIVPVVNADQIKLPYADNYDSYADESYNKSFYDNNGNKTGVYQFYNPKGDTLEITSDSYAPERGKVVKSVSSYGADHYLRYYFGGSYSKGKILVKYDLKVQGNDFIRIVQREYNQYGNFVGGYSNIFNMHGNTTQIKDNTLGWVESTYTHNEYNTVKHIFDLDAGTVTTYFKDKVGTATLLYPLLAGFDVCFVPNSAPQGVSVYIDDMVIRQISGTVEPTLYAGEDGEVIGTYSGVTDTLKLTLDGDSFDSAPELKILDLGTSPVAVTEREIEVADSELTSDGAIYYLEEELESGKRYKVTVEDVKTSYAQTMTKTEYTFICSETNGYKVTVLNEDFGKVEALKPIVAADPIYEGSELTYFSASGDYELITDEKYRGGKALKLGNGGAIGYRFADTYKGIKNGDIELEAHLIPGVATNYKIGNDEFIQNSMLNIGAVNAYTYFTAPPENGSVLWTKAFSHDGDVVVKFDVDLDEKKYVANIDGTVDVPRLIDVTKGDLYNRGFVFLNLATVTGGHTIVDYLTFKHSVLTPAVTKVTFVDAYGAETEYKVGEKLSGTKAMKVYFSEAMNTAKMNEISVAAGDKKVLAEGSYENNVYTLTLKEELVSGTEYTVNIPAGIASAANGTGMQEAVTGVVVTETPEMTVKITDTEGNTLTSFSQTGSSIKVVGENIVAKDGKAIVAFAGYNGGKLIEMTFDEFEITTENKGTLELPVTFKNKSGITVVKGFVLEDLETLKPLCAAAEI